MQHRGYSKLGLMAYYVALRQRLAITNKVDLCKLIKHFTYKFIRLYTFATSATDTDTLNKALCIPWQFCLTTKISLHLCIDMIFKAGSVTAVTSQVIQRHPKFTPKGLGKHPLDCLRFNFYLFKQRLLFGCTPIRGIPVTKIRKFPAFIP